MDRYSNDTFNRAIRKIVPTFNQTLSSSQFLNNRYLSVTAMINLFWHWLMIDIPLVASNNRSLASAAVLNN